MYSLSDEFLETQSTIQENVQVLLCFHYDYVWDSLQVNVVCVCLYT